LQGNAGSWRWSSYSKAKARSSLSFKLKSPQRHRAWLLWSKFISTSVVRPHAASMLIAAVRITPPPHETALGPPQLCLHNFQDFLHAPFVACQSRGRGMRLIILANHPPLIAGGSIISARYQRHVEAEIQTRL
jgi:hypothetical protein